MDDRKEYAAFTVPPRAAGPAPETPLTRAGSQTARPDPFNGADFSAFDFAEIEIDEDSNRTNAGSSRTNASSSRTNVGACRAGTTAGEAAVCFFAGVTPAQQIKERAADPIRQKFFDMRSLASDKPFARNDSELFYRQAKFMEDFSDDYENGPKFFMYYPYYQHMGYEQLRAYFTWRTKVRRGEITQIALSFVFLYIYELLSNVGVDSAADGLDKLMAVWDFFKEQDRELDSYVSKWLRDYHIYYELPHDFEDFVTEHGLEKHYSLALILESALPDRLDLWSDASNYDITKSRFYNDGNEQLLNDCFSWVIGGIRDFCAARGARIGDLLVYRVSNRTPWYPFKQALFHNWLNQPDRKVVMPGYERYFCKDNQWTASLPIYYSTQKDFAGYIIRKTESCLRQAVKYKHMLAADSKKGQMVFRELNDAELEVEDLDAVIEKSVADFHKDLTRTVVTVDHANLERIRAEALGTQAKLIVPEPYELSENNAWRSAEGSEHDTDIKLRPPRETLDEGIFDDVFVPGGVPSSTSNSQFDRSGDGDTWAALKGSLSPIELKALSIALQNTPGVKAFADENGVMLEVLADGINEKAADCIGDNILEVTDGMAIYDEYVEKINEMVKLL